MIHVVQTEGPHAEYPHPLVRVIKDENWWGQPCGSCGSEYVQFVNERKKMTFCRRCACCGAARLKLVPIEAKRHG